jgi:predicted regulator of Ras-like GTPase activity (Roadblock/LC7/MglB family)
MASDAVQAPDYRKILKDLQETVPGAVVAMFSGTDGIGIALYHLDPDYDSSRADAELAALLQVSMRAAEGVGLGEVEETVLTAQGGSVVVRSVGKDYYLAVLLEGSQFNLGLARIQLRRAAAEISGSL